MTTVTSQRLRLPPWLEVGRGAFAELPAVLFELGLERPLIVTDPGVAAAGWPERAVAALTAAKRPAEIWDGARPDPDLGHVERCRERLEAAGADSVVAVGGGSVIDTAKVAAVLVTHGGRAEDLLGVDGVRQAGLPLVAVPTTAGSGSEVSSHAVVFDTARVKKEVVAGFHLMARAVVADPDTTVTLPWTETLHGALDGLVHAIEAFVARRATPWTDVHARSAIPRIAAALPRVMADPADAEARSELCLGCLHSGFAMANANAGVIHALGYPLQGRYGVPHGLANAVMAVAALERTWRSRPERYAEVARLLEGGTTSAPASRALAEELPARMARFLAAVGVDVGLGSWAREEDLAVLAEEAILFQPVLHNTPAALTGGDLHQIYRTAWQATSETVP